MNKNFFKVAAFYAFADLLNLEELQRTFAYFLKKEDIKGTVLLAHEGINGTIAGTEAGIDRFKNFLKLNKLAESQSRIFISGPTGSGKELDRKSVV